MSTKIREEKVERKIDKEREREPPSNTDVKLNSTDVFPRFFFLFLSHFQHVLSLLCWVKGFNIFLFTQVHDRVWSLPSLSSDVRTKNKSTLATNPMPCLLAARFLRVERKRAKAREGAQEFVASLLFEGWIWLRRCGPRGIFSIILYQFFLPFFFLFCPSSILSILHRLSALSVIFKSLFPKCQRKSWSTFFFLLLSLINRSVLSKFQRFLFRQIQRKCLPSFSNLWKTMLRIISRCELQWGNFVSLIIEFLGTIRCSVCTDCSKQFSPWHYRHEGIVRFHAM